MSAQDFYPANWELILKLKSDFLIPEGKELPSGIDKPLIIKYNIKTQYGELPKWS